MPEIRELLREGETLLTASDSPRLDAEVLLAGILKRDRAWVLAHGEHVVETTPTTRFRQQLQRRAGGTPVAYLVGYQEFYGRRFAVGPKVLVPRPESEQLVELILAELGEAETVIDVGTGSGCLAITLKLERPELTVVGSDISAVALAIARRNGSVLGAEVTWHETDLCPAIPDPARTIVVANLPYVPTAAYQAAPSIQAEPRLALDGGPDGLDLINRLLNQLPETCQAVLLEIDPSQSDPLRERGMEIVPDLSGRPRFAVQRSPRV